MTADLRQQEPVTETNKVERGSAGHRAWPDPGAWGTADGELQVDVNGVPHQLHQAAEFAPGNGIYDVADPPSLDEVLVIGSGGGNDVAVALERGA